VSGHGVAACEAVCRSLRMGEKLLKKNRSPSIEPTNIGNERRKVEGSDTTVICWSEFLALLPKKIE